MWWTDGLRTDYGRVGAAAVCRHRNGWKSVRSHPGTGHVEVYNAELWVIGVALRESVKKRVALHANGTMDHHATPKVLAKQKQRDKSTTTIEIKKRTAAINSRRQIDPRASVPAPARPQEEGTHSNPHNVVGSREGLAENATDTMCRQSSKQRRGLPDLPQ